GYSSAALLARAIAVPSWPLEAAVRAAPSELAERSGCQTSHTQRTVRVSMARAIAALPGASAKRVLGPVPIISLSGPRPASHPAHKRAGIAVPGTNHVQS